MSEVELLDAAEVNPSPVSAVQAERDVSVAMDMLDGDEIIQLSIKPSLWYVPMVSANIVAATLIVAAAAAAVGTSMGWTPAVMFVFQTALICAVLRVAFASLQWASRLYLLTNRRVMTFRGVLNVKVTQSPLNRLADAELEAAWYERPIGLGSVKMLPRADDDPPLIWTHLSRPVEIHELLVRAIHRSRGDSH